MIKNLMRYNHIRSNNIFKRTFVNNNSLNKRINLIPMKRMAKSQEISNYIYWLSQ